MSKPLLLDLFCGAGGAARGYQRAGFYVVGIDINPQPRYAGDEFIQADAITFPLGGFDVTHASPPCQRYSIGTRTGRYGQPESYPDLIAATRKRLAGRSYIIENVEGASRWMRNPVRLCGEMFGLRVVRHRLFESSLPLVTAPHRRHHAPIQHSKADGTTVQRSWYCQVAGHGGDSPIFTLKAWSEAMGIDWMTKGELIEAIPPAYTEFIGRQLRGNLLLVQRALSD